MGYKQDLHEATHNLCDKCGRPVPPANDMTMLIAASGLPGAEWAPTLWYSRHLLPVMEDGERVCEGSPSRAQYLEGQPRDTRGYDYDHTMEEIYRKAWIALCSRLADS